MSGAFSRSHPKPRTADSSPLTSLQPEDLELLSNTDVLPLGMTMSALLQGQGGAHEPPRCEWRRGVENGVEVEKVIIDVSYRARRVKVEPRDSPIVIDD